MSDRPYSGPNQLAAGMCADGIHLEFGGCCDQAPLARPRTFHLDRSEDVSGVSGAGIVAWGVQFPDGRVSTRWAQSPYGRQTAVWDSIEDVEAVHGHGGATRVVWHDEAP